MLGMTQLLMFVDAHASNVGAIYELSRDAAQEFPMAPLSINLTHIALKAVRKGLLNARAKALGSVWKAADQFYVGAFIEFYDRWKEGECTMRDSGFVKAALEETPPPQPCGAPAGSALSSPIEPVAVQAELASAAAGSAGGHRPGVNLNA